MSPSEPEGDHAQLYGMPVVAHGVGVAVVEFAPVELGEHPDILKPHIDAVPLRTAHLPAGQIEPVREQHSLMKEPLEHAFNAVLGRVTQLLDERSTYLPLSRLKRFAQQ